MLVLHVTLTTNCRGGRATYIRGTHRASEKY